MNIPENVLKLAPWSTSMMQTALTCPRLFHEKYILKNKPEREEDKATQVGTIVHKVLEFAVQGVSVQKALSATFDFYDNTLTEQIRDETLMFRDSIEDFLRGLDTFKRTQRVTKIYPEQKIAVTPDFKSTKFFDKGGLFRGVIDLTLVTGDGRAVVIDHKSGALKPLFKYQDQLDGYAVLLEALIPNLKAARAAVHFVGADITGDQKRTVWDREHPADYIRDTLRMRLIERLSKAANHVTQTNTPSTSWMCTYCGYEPSCPAT
jgi:ATP-dependent exoDNAse (exonuclease V) beta subunit